MHVQYQSDKKPFPPAERLRNGGLAVLVSSLSRAPVDPDLPRAFYGALGAVGVMESLLAKALESKLKYYLRSYTRDQFKLTGRTVQLSNLGM